MKIAFTGGGTGGHFYPIIAVAQKTNQILTEEKILGAQLYYISTEPYDRQALFENNLIFEEITTGKLRVYFSFKNFFDIFKTIFGIIKGLIRVFSIYPDVIFSKGGYASFPTVFAARILRIPLIIHESDAAPGRANLWASKFAYKIAISFPESAEYFPKIVDVIPYRKGRSTDGKRKILIREFVYSTTLSRVVKSSLATKLNYLVNLARSIISIEQTSLIVDYSLDNFAVNGKIIDLSHAVTNSLPIPKRTAHFAILGNYETTAPETWMQRTVDARTEVFSFAVMCYQFLTGKHPFVSPVSELPANPVATKLCFGIRNLLAIRDDSTKLKIFIPSLELALSADPSQRPTMVHLVEDLESALEELNKSNSTESKVLSTTTSNDPHALMPLRAGVLHRGHVEVICRLISMGFFVDVSLQKTYTLTSEDPIPKWHIARLLTNALSELGINSGYKIWFCPFYETDSQHRRHFLLAPFWEDVKLIASDNPDVRNMVCTITNAPFLNTSWLFTGEAKLFVRGTSRKLRSNLV
jgi:hypothetical protein